MLPQIIVATLAIASTASAHPGQLRKRATCTATGHVEGGQFVSDSAQNAHNVRGNGVLIVYAGGNSKDFEGEYLGKKMNRGAPQKIEDAGLPNGDPIWFGETKGDGICFERCSIDYNGKVYDGEVSGPNFEFWGLGTTVECYCTTEFEC